MALEKYKQNILIIHDKTEGASVENFLTSHFGMNGHKAGSKTIEGVDREGKCTIVQEIGVIDYFNPFSPFADLKGFDGIIFLADLIEYEHFESAKEKITYVERGKNCITPYLGDIPCLMVGIEEDAKGCREQQEGTAEEARNFADVWGIPYLGCSLRSLNKEVAGAMFTTIAEQIIVRGENVTRDPAAQKKMLKETLPQEIKEYKSEINKSDYSKVMDGKSAKTDGGTKIKPEELRSNTDIIGEGFLKKLQRESDQETTVDEANKFIRNHPNLGPKTQARIRVEQGRQSGDVCYYAHAVTTLSNAKISNSDPLMMEANGRMGMERGAPGQAIKSASR